MMLCTMVQDPNGNPNVLVLNGNADNRKLNLNYTANRWNRNYVFVGVRRSLHSLLRGHFGGVCFASRFLYQPPSILPIS